MNAKRPQAAFFLNAFDLIYGEEWLGEIRKRVDVLGSPIKGKDALKHEEILREAELIFSGWGAPKMDEAFLQAAPKLKAVFYGAGSIKGMVSDAFWDRSIQVTSAYAGNAVPVAEMTFAHIILCLKRVPYLAREVKNKCEFFYHPHQMPGCFGTTVGLVSLGMIGRMVRDRLRSLELNVIAYDPFVTPDQGRELQVEMVSLPELFRRADVVSLHTPWLKETEGLITGELISSMKPHASFINTSRGAVIRENELIETARKRDDLEFVLDVTWPEPPEPDSALYKLPNVTLTPHIAGSIGPECRRLGRIMVEELDRYLAGETMKYSLTKKQAETMA